MNTPKATNENDFLLSFSDLVSLVKNNRRKIYRWAATCATIALVYALFKPVEYEAEATFKEKGKKRPRIDSSLSAALMFVAEGQQDSDALTMMRSRMLIEELIRHQGLQGVVSKEEAHFPIPLENVRDNLIAEYALLRKIPVPIINEPVIDIRTATVRYDGETPLTLKFKVTSAAGYDLFDASGTLIGQGAFGKPLATDRFAFTLVKQPGVAVDSGRYRLTLLPLGPAAKAMAKQFTIETDKGDKNLLAVSHRNRSRHQAASNVNALMKLYQQHIEDEHLKISGMQFGYLTERQKSMQAELEGLMGAYAQDLSSDLSTTGFATSEKAMEFLADNQQKLKQKLFTINLEIQRLEDVKRGKNVDGELFLATHELDAINKIASEKRALKQQEDSLNLALRDTKDTDTAFQEAFCSLFEALDDVKHCVADTAKLTADLESHLNPTPSQRLLENPRFIVKAWYERLTLAKTALDKRPTDQEVFNYWRQCKEGFNSYLANLSHYLKVYQRNLEERLAHQQVLTDDFRGIDLNIARELYISYSRELSELESKSKQHEFIISQIDEPAFEISSLSMIFSDPLSIDMISKTSALILSLKDKDNRTAKEQDRLLADVSIQKAFLKTHVQQSITLLGLRQEFLKEKIKTLQNVNLALVQEQISILENQLNDHLANALENLKREQSLLEQNLVELRIEMAAFPQKWTAEQLIAHKMEINKTLTEEIAKLVESNNISNNLEKFQSSPVDASLAPIHPRPPHLLLLTFLGALGGAFLAFASTLFHSVVRGVTPSEASLRSSGCHVSGSLSQTIGADGKPLLANDISTLRRLIAFLAGPAEKKKVVLLLEGAGPDYAGALAGLAARSGKKVVVVDLHFDAQTTNKERSLLAYLEGKVARPDIVHEGRYDRIIAGNISRYASELLATKRFDVLLESLAHDYDWVLVNSSAVPQSAEAESLVKRFDIAVVTVGNATIQELAPYLQKTRSPEASVTFLLSTNTN